MTFAPVNLTIGDIGGLLAIAAGLFALFRWLFLPKMREMMEDVIASDRGIKQALRETLGTELKEVAGLRTSVDELRVTMQTTTSAFGEFRDLVHGEMHELHARFEHKMGRMQEELARAMRLAEGSAKTAENLAEKLRTDATRVRRTDPPDSNPTREV